jgi:hypothetical protein
MLQIKLTITRPQRYSTHVIKAKATTKKSKLEKLAITEVMNILHTSCARPRVAVVLSGD